MELPRLAPFTVGTDAIDASKGFSVGIVKVTRACVIDHRLHEQLGGGRWHVLEAIDSVGTDAISDVNSKGTGLMIVRRPCVST